MLETIDKTTMLSNTQWSQNKHDIHIECGHNQQRKNIHVKFSLKIFRNPFIGFCYLP